ncbi:MAG: HmuY family protein [Alcanivorax sp.]|nr:HmuY family protein [Alcanivorax sp.]
MRYDINSQWRALLLGAATLALAACGGSSSSSTPPDVVTNNCEEDSGVLSCRYNASSYADWVYVNLETGDEVAEESEWHVALRRTELRLNGGDSGPSSVAGVLVAAQDDFYDGDGEPNASVFLNATPESELSVLLEDYPAPANRNWVVDGLASAFGGMGDWYLYNQVSPECDAGAGLITANPDNGWLVKSGEGNSYARVRATDIVFCTRDGNGVETFTFEFDVQVPDSDQFTTEATFTGTLPPAGGEICFDFDADEIVDCTGNVWDIKAGFAGTNFFLRSNSGDSGEGAGGVFGPHEWADLATWQSATIDPDSGEPIPSQLFAADSSSGIFAQQSWYAYNLQGNHRLWPNYRVYRIDTDRDDDDAPQFQLQVTGYYSEGGASGHPRLRWRQLDLNTAQE